ncbi:MAG: His/Gly/Thr/Pro-type tRNA ligase C-terminal domain-containing protein [Desulfosudis oleivorans]|nr:His/Gly/Thr/Pro-type tRNA ligase C-terminal domain-containing protein [Desulfosudis oleivorans]
MPAQFPLWLAPVQVAILTIAERQEAFAREIYKALREADVRAEINVDNEKIGYKIREATLRKVPYLVIIGDREVEDRNVTVRKRSGEKHRALHDRGICRAHYGRSQAEDVDV